MGSLLLLVSFGGSILLFCAAVLARRFDRSRPAPTALDPVTIVKPLYGAEPRLIENLAGFLAQDHAAPVQLLCGMQRPDDPAIAAVEALRRTHPDATIDLIVDGRRHGSNAKIGNLINMAGHIRHDIVVLSDSDIAVDRAYLGAILEALAKPGVGAVTCLYRGRADRGVWSRLGAMGIDLHFLPGALIGLAAGLARPCMGSTIALRRETLDRIGGFAAFVDILADDHAIGEAVRGLGLEVAVPDMLVTHGCDEASFAALWRQELRWNATIAGIDPLGYAGSFILHPLPIALLGGACIGFSGTAWAAIALALGARGVMALRLGECPAALLLIPLRDMLSVTLFILGNFARSVDWRGARLTMTKDGRVRAETENSE